jgi:hypothetical protein
MLKLLKVRFTKFTDRESEAHEKKNKGRMIIKLYEPGIHLQLPAKKRQELVDIIF